MKHTGSCHCGKVKYEVEIDLSKIISCNCSICQKKGTLLGFTPANKFKLLQGEDSLTNYQFYKKRIHHLFCSTCGVTSFAKGISPDGQEVRAINIRCLDNIDLDKLQIMKFDGKSI